MPSVSPGDETASSFQSILPGAPTAGHQSLTTFVFRWKRYIIYISNKQLNILRSPTELVQAITFDHELVAVRAEAENNGRFAVATKDGVWILYPETSATNRVTWTRELHLSPYQKEQARTLCWGAEGELLVGYDTVLAGYNTTPTSRASTPLERPSTGQCDERAPYWTKSTSSPVMFAEFSPDGDYVATTGLHDRIVKIWRRLSYEDAIFDYAYLPHDTAVTHLEWRSRDAEILTSDTVSVRSYHVSDEHCDVLYTLSADAKMRVWRTNGHSDLDLLSLFATIDLVSAIPHSPILPKKDAFSRPTRYAFILPYSQYNLAVEAALKKTRPDQVKHSIEHIKEVSSKKPDIVVTLDTQGRMSAWGLSSVGHKRRPTSSNDATATPFHVAHSESIGMAFSANVPAAFETWFDGDMLNILALNFGDSVAWWRGSVEDFSSSSAIETERGEEIVRWQGSNAKIASLCSAHDMNSMYAIAENGAVHQWSASSKEIKLRKSTSLNRQVVVVDSVQRDKSLLALTANEIILARLADDKGLSTIKHDPSNAGLKWLRIDSSNSTADEEYLVYSNDGQYQILEVNPTRSDWQSEEPIVRIKKVTISNQLPIHSSTTSSELSTKQVHVLNHPRKQQWLRLVGLGQNGELWRRDVSVKALLSSDQAVEDTLEFTSVVSPDSSAATGDLVAIVSNQSKKFVIVDLKQGYVEHEQTLSEKATSVVFPACKIDDFSSSRQSLLAISYDHTVDVLARSRYNHHHDGEPHEWTIIKKLSIAGIGSSISAVNWLNDGRLAVATGNTLFISSNEITSKALSIDNQQRFELIAEDDIAGIQQIAKMLDGPVSCWQPGILRQLILHDCFEVVLTILKILEEKLRFYSEGDVLDPMLGLDIGLILDRHSSTGQFDEEILSRLRDQLIDINLPYTSDADQERLKLVVAAVAYVLRHRQSLDSFAIRYLFQWQYQSRLAEHKANSAQTTPNGHVDTGTSKTAPTMHWREIVFAYHSTTQQPLLEILVRHHENKLDWQTVWALGITLWLRTIKAAQSEGSAMASIEQIFDSLGQNAYRATYPPDPVQASLFLLALRKKAVLLSLWRVAVGNREQKTTQNFLKRDFSDEKNRVAARKNAYALMGKRRFEYAAAFFLLADDAASAISILAGQCEDLQLAVAVARAFCGDGSAELKKLMRERVIPAAKKQGDRWLMHWAHAACGQDIEASKALVANFEDLLSESETSLPRAWQQDDPITTVLYCELRDVVGADGKKKAGSAVSVNEEYRAVLRSARVLRRLGFWLLALKMTSQWNFVKQEVVQQHDEISNGMEESVQTTAVPSMLDAFDDPPTKQSGVDSVPQSMLDSFQNGDSNQTAAPMSDADERAARAAALLAKMKAKKDASQNAAQKSDPKSKEQPTQFNEPAASSILDSFGF